MSLLPETLFDEAKAHLRRIEAQHGVRILYASEAGSRSWGFASPDADVDVRFIYVRPIKHYLRLTPEGEMLESQEDPLWDIKGWDLRHVLKSLRDGDTTLVQWLYSPIVYRNHPLFLTEMRKLLDRAHPLARLYWAYRSTAQAHHAMSLRKSQFVSFKRLIYIVQAVLAFRWVELKKSIPPMRFDELVKGLVEDEALLLEIDTLIQIKSANKEDAEGDKNAFPNVVSYIESSLAETLPPEVAGDTLDAETLDQFFLQWIGYNTI